VAWNAYDIDPDVARPIVQRARGRFEDLQGLENQLELTGEAVADAAQEDDINAALKTIQTDFLRPFVVTMIRTAENIFDTADNVVNIYANADTTMADDAAARQRAVEQMEGQARAYDNVPAYSAGDTTSPDGQGAEANTEGYDW